MRESGRLPWGGHAAVQHAELRWRDAAGQPACVQPAGLRHACSPCVLRRDSGFLITDCRTRSRTGPTAGLASRSCTLSELPATPAISMVMMPVMQGAAVPEAAALLRPPPPACELSPAIHRLVTLVQSLRQGGSAILHLQPCLCRAKLRRKARIHRAAARSSSRGALSDDDSQSDDEPACRPATNPRLSGVCQMGLLWRRPLPRLMAAVLAGSSF